MTRALELVTTHSFFRTCAANCENNPGNVSRGPRKVMNPAVVQFLLQRTCRQIDEDVFLICTCFSYLHVFSICRCSLDLQCVELPLCQPKNVIE